MDSKNLVLIIIIALVFFVLGGGAGVYFISQTPLTKEGAANQIALKTLSSKVIPSIVAYGEVTNISGKNVTVAYAGDSATVAIANSAQVYSFIQQAGSASPTQQKTDFAAIKKGDTLNIALKLLADGTLQGQSVIILKTAAVAK